jgi:hypothetical protein
MICPGVGNVFGATSEVVLLDLCTVLHVMGHGRVTGMTKLMSSFGGHFM